jgi:predicted transcriptional regulator
METKHTALVKEVRALRKSRGLSQIGLAQRAGRVQARVSEFETADQDPRLSTVLAIVDALDAELVPVPREKLDQVRRAIGQPRDPRRVVTDVFDEVFVPSSMEEDE